MKRLLGSFVFMFLGSGLAAQTRDGNRLAYLDELNLYYPSHTFPKLITPQWVGEKGVEAVVILAIDDMKDSKKYETYLRPILDRLKKIDGRAPVSIMACSADPKDPQLQAWLKEGLSIECHTFDHPCPFFKFGFKRARETYEKCVDLMHEVPGNQPVAYRMPCCDSMNTPSPRFFAEIFNKTTEKGKFLTIDSSVFMAFTSKDPELPKELVLDRDGKERFLEYFPKDRAFVNWIENYPYPYMIGRQCWQFPCMTPSDWQAQHRHKPFNPQTVEDWKAALDCTVIKKGVFTMVFHPHGWIKADQVVELIDYAEEKYKGKVKFLTFKEAEERLRKNVQLGFALRYENEFKTVTGIQALDLDGDGFQDFVIGDSETRKTLVWNMAALRWEKGDLPYSLANKDGTTFLGTRFFVGVEGRTEVLHLPTGKTLYWTMGKWKENPGRSLASTEGTEGAWLLDVDGDGRIEVLRHLGKESWIDSQGPKGWFRLPFVLPFHPSRPSFVFDSGIRFADLNADGKLDLIYSNEEEYGIYLFTDMKAGWGKKVLAGKRGDKGELPMISKNGTNHGFWIHSGHFWWSNEDTTLLRDFVDRRAIGDLLRGIK